MVMNISLWGCCTAPTRRPFAEALWSVCVPPYIPDNEAFITKWGTVHRDGYAQSLACRLFCCSNGLNRPCHWWWMPTHRGRARIKCAQIPPSPPTNGKRLPCPNHTCKRAPPSSKLPLWLPYCGVHTPFQLFWVFKCSAEVNLSLREWFYYLSWYGDGLCDMQYHNCAALWHPMC